MRERVHTNKKSNNNSSTSVQNSFHTRPFITQRAQNPNGVPTQEDIVNQQYQQDRFEATKLEIQAKYGTITPEGQERLAVLQAKKAEFWQRYLGKTGLYGHDFSQIPLHSTDVPRQQTIQPKLTIGAPGDKYEQEADRVAAQVVNQINSPVAQQSNQNLQREEIPVIQTRPWLRLQAKNEGMAAPAELESSIQQARGGGQPLADNVRKPMEYAFGTDFSGVKVHTDAQADQLNQSIQAKAFTTGQDVFFRQGEYQPGSRGGQELLAHELTHVVQQNGGAVQRSNNNFAHIQRMFTQTHVEINTLEQLNQELFKHNAINKPIVINADVADVDAAIANSDFFLYNYIDGNEVVDKIKEQLSQILKPPEGYEKITNEPFEAFVKSALNLNKAQQKLLVLALNNQGEARHQTHKAKGVAADANAYIHDYKDNAIFSFKDDGKHKGVPMGTVLQWGKVSRGVHKFG